MGSRPRRMGEGAVLARTLLQAIASSGYFVVVGEVTSPAEATRLLDRGAVQFVIHVPVDFSRALLRGDTPALLVDADATDPAATGNAVAALRTLIPAALGPEARGVLAGLSPPEPVVDLRLHANYNPEAVTQYNIVPGLMGEVFPLTHFLRIVRGILLKGNGLGVSLHHAWPIALFMVVALAIGAKRYRKTLD